MHSSRAVVSSKVCAVGGNVLLHVPMKASSWSSEQSLCKYHLVPAQAPCTHSCFTEKTWESFTISSLLIYCCSCLRLRYCCKHDLAGLRLKDFPLISGGVKGPMQAVLIDRGPCPSVPVCSASYKEDVKNG